MAPAPTGCDGSRLAERYLRAFVLGIPIVYAILLALAWGRVGTRDLDQFLVFHELQSWNHQLFGLAKQWTPVLCSGLSLADEPQVPFMSLSMMLGYVFGPLAGLDLKQFGREAATDGQTYPPLQDMLTLWKKSSASLLPALKAVSDTDLLRERDSIKLPHGEKRWLDALVFYVWHEAYHLGHIGVLRSQFGLTPIVNLVLGQTTEPALANKA